MYKQFSFGKRALSLFLATLTLLSVLPFSVLSNISFAAENDTVSSGQVKVIGDGRKTYQNDYHWDYIYYAAGKQINLYQTGINSNGRGAGSAEHGASTTEILEKVILMNKKQSTNINQTSVPIYRIWRAGGHSNSETNVTADLISDGNNLETYWKNLMSKANKYIAEEKINTPTLSAARAKMIALVLQYGFRQHTNASGARPYDEQLMYAATQILIWEIQEGKRKPNNWGTEDSSYEAKDTSSWRLADPTYWRDYWYTMCKNKGIGNYYKLICDACASATEPMVTYQNAKTHKVITGSLTDQSFTEQTADKSKVVEMTQFAPNNGSNNAFSTKVKYGEGYSSNINYEEAMSGVRYIGWDVYLADYFTNNNYLNNTITAFKAYARPQLAYIAKLKENGTASFKQSDERFIDTEYTDYVKINQYTTYTIVGQTLDRTMWLIRRDVNGSAKYWYVYKNDITDKQKDPTSGGKITFNFNPVFTQGSNLVSFYATKPSVPTAANSYKVISDNFVRTGYNSLFAFQGGTLSGQGFVCGGNGSYNRKYLHFSAKNNFDLAVTSIEQTGALTNAIHNDGTTLLSRKKMTVTFKNVSAFDVNNVGYTIAIQMKNRNAIGYSDGTLESANRNKHYFGVDDISGFNSADTKIVTRGTNKENLISDSTVSYCVIYGKFNGLSANGTRTVSFYIYTSRLGNEGISESKYIAAFNNITVTAAINGGRQRTNNDSLLGVPNDAAYHRYWIEGNNNYAVNQDNKNGLGNSWYYNNARGFTVKMNAAGNEFPNLVLTAKLQPSLNKEDNIYHDGSSETKRIDFSVDVQNVLSQPVTNLKGKLKAYRVKVVNGIDVTNGYEEINFGYLNAYQQGYNVTLYADDTIRHFDLYVNEPVNENQNVSYRYVFVINGTLTKNGEFTRIKTVDITNATTHQTTTYPTQTETLYYDNYDDVVAHIFQSTDLKITVDTDKKVYEYDEEGSGTVTITNLSGKKIVPEDNVVWAVTTSSIAKLKETDETTLDNLDIVSEGILENLEVGQTITIPFSFSYPSVLVTEDETGEQTTEKLDTSKQHITFTAIINGGNEETAELGLCQYTNRNIEETQYNNNLSQTSIDLFNLVDFSVDLCVSDQTVTGNEKFAAVVVTANNIENSNFGADPIVHIYSDILNISKPLQETSDSEKLTDILNSKYGENSGIQPVYTGVSESGRVSPNDFMLKIDRSLFSEEQKTIAFKIKLSSDNTEGFKNVNADINVEQTNESAFDFTYGEQNYNVRTNESDVFNYQDSKRNDKKMYEHYDWLQNIDGYQNNFASLPLYATSTVYRYKIVNGNGDVYTNVLNNKNINQNGVWKQKGTGGVFTDKTFEKELSKRTDIGSNYYYCSFGNKEKFYRNTLYTLEAPNKDFITDINNKYFNSSDTGKVRFFYADNSGTCRELNVNGNKKDTFLTSDYSNYPTFYILYEPGTDVPFSSSDLMKNQISRKYIMEVCKGMKLHASGVNEAITYLNNIYTLKINTFPVSLEDEFDKKQSVLNDFEEYVYETQWKSWKDDGIYLLTISKKDSAGQAIQDKLETALKVNYYSESPNDLLQRIDYQQESTTPASFANLDTKDPWLLKENDEDSDKYVLNTYSEDWEYVYNEQAMPEEYSQYPQYLSLKLSDIEDGEYNLFFNKMTVADFKSLLNSGLQISYCTDGNISNAVAINEDNIFSQDNRAGVRIRSNAGALKLVFGGKSLAEEQAEEQKLFEQVNKLLKSVSLYKTSALHSYNNGENDITVTDNEEKNVVITNVSKYAAIEIEFDIKKLNDIYLDLATEGESYLLNNKKGYRFNKNSQLKYDDYSNAGNLFNSYLPTYNLEWRRNSDQDWTVLSSSINNNNLVFKNVPNGEFRVTGTTNKSSNPNRFVPYQSDYSYDKKNNCYKIPETLNSSEFVYTDNERVENISTDYTDNASTENIQTTFTVNNGEYGRINMTQIFKPVYDYAINNLTFKAQKGKVYATAEVSNYSPLPGFIEFHVGRADGSYTSKSVFQYTDSYNTTNLSICVDDYPFEDEKVGTDWYAQINYPDKSNYTEKLKDLDYSQYGDYGPCSAASVFDGNIVLGKDTFIPFENNYSNNIIYAKGKIFQTRLHVDFISTELIQENQVRNNFGQYSLLKKTDSGYVTVNDIPRNKEIVFRNLKAGKYMLCNTGIFDDLNNDENLTLSSDWTNTSTNDVKYLGIGVSSTYYEAADTRNYSQKILTECIKPIDWYNTTHEEMEGDIVIDKTKVYSKTENGIVHEAVCVEFTVLYNEKNDYVFHLEVQPIFHLSAEIEVVENNIQEEDNIVIEYKLHNDSLFYSQANIYQLYAGDKLMKFGSADTEKDYLTKDLNAGETITGKITIPNVSAILHNGTLNVSIEVNTPMWLSGGSHTSTKFEQLINKERASRIKNRMYHRTIVPTNFGVTSKTISWVSNYLPLELDYLDNRAQVYVQVSQPSLEVEIVNTQGNYVAGKEVITTCKVINPSSTIFFEKSKLFGQLTVLNDSGDTILTKTTRDNPDNKYIVVPAKDGDNAGENLFWFKWKIPNDIIADELNEGTITLRASILSEDPMLNQGINPDLYLKEKLQNYSDFEVEEDYVSSLKNAKYESIAAQYLENGYYGESRNMLVKTLQLMPYTTYVIDNNYIESIGKDGYIQFWGSDKKGNFNEYPVQQNAPVTFTGGMYIFNETDSPLLSLQTNREEYLMSKSSSDRYKGWNHKVYFTTGETGTIKIGFAQSIYDEDTYNTMYNDMLKYIKCNVLTNSENHTHGNLDLALADTKTRTVIRTEAKHTADTHFEKYMPEDTEYAYEQLSYEQAYANSNRIWHENLLFNTQVKSGILSSWKVWEEYDPGVALVQRTMRISKKPNYAEGILNDDTDGILNVNSWLGGNPGEVAYQISIYPMFSKSVFLISSANEKATDSNETFEYFNKNLKYATSMSGPWKNVKDAQVISASSGVIYLSLPYFKNDASKVEQFKKWAKKYFSDLYLFDYNFSTTANFSEYQQHYKDILDKEKWSINNNKYEYILPPVSKNEGYHIASLRYNPIYIQSRKNGTVLNNYSLGSKTLDIIATEDNTEVVIQIPTIYSWKSVYTALKGLRIERNFAYQDGTNDSYIVHKDPGFYVNYQKDQKNNGFNTDAEIFLKKSGYGIDYVFEPEQADIFLCGNQNITSDMIGNAKLTGGKCAIPKTVDVSVVYPEYMNDTEEGHYDYFTNVNGQLNFTHFTPLWNPDGPYIPTAIIHDIWTPTGEIQYYWDNDDVEIHSDLTKDWHIRHKSTVTPGK